jgi:hypothetical protein
MEYGRPFWVHAKVVVERGVVALEVAAAITA